MVANLVLDNAKVYDVNRFDIELGQKFSLEIIEDDNDPVQPNEWFSNNDQVLKMEPGTNLSQFEATAFGDSLVKIMKGDVVVKTFTIHVFNDEAVTLNLKAEAPVLK